MAREAHGTRSAWHAKRMAREAHGTTRCRCSSSGLALAAWRVQMCGEPGGQVGERLRPDLVLHIVGVILQRDSLPLQNRPCALGPLVGNHAILAPMREEDRQPRR